MMLKALLALAISITEALTSAPEREQNLEWLFQ